MKSGFFAAVAACSLLLTAPASAQGVKIGVLNDQSGVYADYGGKYSVEAAKMAIEDFGGEVLGQNIELVSADHQNKPDLAPLVRRRGRRHDHRAHDLVGGARGAGAFQGKEEINIVVGAATSAITGSACSPYGFHWDFDTHTLAVCTGGALVKTGGVSSPPTMLSATRWKKTPARSSPMPAAR